MAECGREFLNQDLVCLQDEAKNNATFTSWIDWIAAEEREMFIYDGKDLDDEAPLRSRLHLEERRFSNGATMQLLRVPRPLLDDSITLLELFSNLEFAVLQVFVATGRRHEHYM